MYCNNCGNQLPEGTKFCNNCGASQAEAPAQPAETVAPNPPAAPKKNNTLKLVIVAAVALVCFVIGSFVIAPALSKDKANDDPSDDVSQSQNADANDNKVDNDVDTPDVSDKKELQAIDGGYNQGKMFMSDMGEYGKVSLSVGYNPENGVVRQVTASFTITVRHSEYAAMKTDFAIWEDRIKESDDKNVEASYVELSESVSFIIGLTELNEADRADRVALAEEILDFVADEKDQAFYIDDLTTLLVDTYGFTVS